MKVITYHYGDGTKNHEVESFDDLVSLVWELKGDISVINMFVDFEDNLIDKESEFYKSYVQL